MTPLPNARVFSALSEAIGRDVVKIEVLPIVDGQTVTLRFEGGESTWRQGVWLATEGELDLDGYRSSQLVVWRDAAPAGQVKISVVETDGLLRLHNVWDSGRGLSPYESQSASSGMLVTEVENRRTYESSDIAADPKFDRLTFSITVGEDAG